MASFSHKQILYTSSSRADRSGTLQGPPLPRDRRAALPRGHALVRRGGAREAQAAGRRSRPQQARERRERRREEKGGGAEEGSEEKRRVKSSCSSSLSLSAMKMNALVTSRNRLLQRIGRRFSKRKREEERELQKRKKRKPFLSFKPSSSQTPWPASGSSTRSCAHRPRAPATPASCPRRSRSTAEKP